MRKIAIGVLVTVLGLGWAGFKVYSHLAQKRTEAERTDAFRCEAKKWREMLPNVTI